MKLDLIRCRIDEIDSAIAELLSERLGLSSEISAIKSKMNMPIEDTSREQTVLNRIAAWAKSDAEASAMKQIYTQVMLASKTLQREGEARFAIDSDAPLQFSQVAVLGVGLIGSALCRQMRRCQPQAKVIGFDSDEVLARAVEHGVIDEAAADLKNAVKSATLIVLSASPAGNLELLEKIAPLLDKSVIVVDVSSTKGKIVALAERLELSGAEFIGGHPLFGSEKRGLEAGLQLDVDGRVFCLVPTAKSSSAGVERLSAWIRSLNMKVATIEALEHDRILARTSHMVQILSILLGGQLAHERSEADLTSLLQFIGPSFKQLSRLMKSPAGMWSEIILQNKAEIEQALDDFEAQFKKLRAAVGESDSQKIAALFQEARRVPAAIENSAQ
ncbi:MAG TPA: bifunctional chorismate mutase/prephenate dehydrogenase [Chroococcales cyanobacterium]